MDDRQLGNSHVLSATFVGGSLEPYKSCVVKTESEGKGGVGEGETGGAHVHLILRKRVDLNTAAVCLRKTRFFL